MTRIFIGFVVVILGGGMAGGFEVPFSAGTDLTTSFTDVRVVVAADFNRDTFTDLMAAGEGEGAVRLWTGLGNGSFTQSTVVSGLGAPSCLAVGDLDGDGDLDVVIGQSENVTGVGEGEVMWLANPEVGAASIWISHVAAAYTNNKVNDLWIADVDHDGKLDIVVSKGINEVGIDWLENNGAPASGPWPSHQVDGDFSGLSVAAADLDNDGDMDIISRIPGANAVRWWENDGVPSDDWTSHEVDGGVSYLGDIACGDVTGDGQVDIVVAVPSTDDVFLFESSGSGWIRREVAPASANDPYSVQIVDMDVDGDQDILAAVLYSNAVVWYENTDGTGATWVQRTVSASMEYAASAVAADLDGDGDLDVAAGGLFSDTVAWFENRLIHRTIDFADPLEVRNGLGEPRSVVVADVNRDGLMDMLIGEWDDDTITLYLGVNPDAGLWSEQTVASSFDRVRDVAVADMDGDGDLDVVGAAVGSDQVWWWANDGEEFPSWSSHPVLNGFDGAHMAEPADIDDDGDMDLVVAGLYEDEVAWVQNTDGTGSSWTKTPLVSADGAHDAVVGDLNGDGMLDVAFSAYYDDEIKVLLNPIGSGDFWDLVTVVVGVDGPRGISLADLDGDGDLDIGAALRIDNQIAWYENNGTGLSWSPHVVGSGLLIDGADVQFADINRDGDVDVIGTSQSQGEVWVWRNGGGAGSWSSWKVENSLASPWGVAAADVDGDGWTDLTVVGGSTADSLNLYRHVGGQCGVGAWSTAPSEIFAGDEDDILMFTVSHRGVPDADGNIQPSLGKVHFTDEGGIPLTTNQANQIIDRLEIFADTDNNGVFSSGDTLLLVDTYLTLEDGALSLVFGVSLPENQITPNDHESYFVVITATALADEQNPNTIRAMFIDSDLEIEDVTWELPLTASPGSSVTTGLIEFIDPPIFSDDFETGDWSFWSDTVPGSIGVPVL